MNMDDISNDGLNSDLEDHDDDEDEEDFNSYRNRILNDEDIIFNQTDTAHDTSFNSINNKRKKINSTKYCKKRKCRTTFTKSQLITLENEFIKSNFVSNDRIDLLIDLTGLDSRIIKVTKLLTEKKKLSNLLLNSNRIGSRINAQEF